MSAPDTIELLSRIAPLSDEDAVRMFSVAGREQLLEAITRSDPRPVPTARRKVRRSMVVVLVALLVVATATVAWAMTRGGARDTTSIECEIAGTDTVIDATSGSPVADCAAEWRREVGRQAPPLVAYANGNGGVTVLPRSQNPPAGWHTIRSQNVALIRLQESLDDYVNGLPSRCMSTSEATAFARRQLDLLGFAGWTVKIRPVSQQAPVCTDGDIVDPAAATVTLISGTTGAPPADWAPARLATSLRPLTGTCRPLPAMLRAVEQRAGRLGLTPAPPASATSYELHTTRDDRMRCTSLYETVGGAVNIILRGPGS